MQHPFISELDQHWSIHQQCYQRIRHSNKGLFLFGKETCLSSSYLSFYHLVVARTAALISLYHVTGFNEWMGFFAFGTNTNPQHSLTVVISSMDTVRIFVWYLKTLYNEANKNYFAEHFFKRRSYLWSSRAWCSILYHWTLPRNFVNWLGIYVFVLSREYRWCALSTA